MYPENYRLSAISYRLSAIGYGYLRAISYRLSVLSAIGYRLSVISYQLSAISYQLSAIGYRLSLIGYPMSVIGYRLSVIAIGIGYPLSVIGYRLSAISYRLYQLSVISYQHEISKFIGHLPHAGLAVASGAQVQGRGRASGSRRNRPGETLPLTVKNHQSLLRRKLGSLDMRFQENKVTNLEIARQPIDGLLIKPGETFSFWQRVGETTSKKATSKAFGCRAERSRPASAADSPTRRSAALDGLSFAARDRRTASSQFRPVSRRPASPFGSGAGVFYNYIDLRFQPDRHVSGFGSG
ncbi:MAG: VanW family protein [Acidobacteria bacterium]|nr:VanW family protein [Acidobacteriota bacterium]